MLEDFRLKAFAAVARTGSFTRAAAQLGVSQPAISQNISELEKYAGGRLLVRSRAGVRLTPMGEELMRHAVAILDCYKAADEAFRVPETLLFRHIVLPSLKQGNVLVRDGVFADLDAPEDTPADKVIDASGLGILPSFFNTHTHAAMTLMRGYGEDRNLRSWLEDYVWPFEDRMTAEDVRRGSDIAVQEMTGSGTTFFSDMYFEIEQTVRAVEESGMRAAIGITVMENHPKSVADAKMDFVRNWSDPTHGRISLTIAPHAVYTVGPEKLRRSARFARENGLPIHIHVSETAREVSDCIRNHGTTPVRYLESLGVLGPDVIAAHCVHVDEEEWKILGRRKVTVAHCPCSNMKLSSGRFPYELAMESGCRISIGTDGASSNNSLDMREEVKFAALLAKIGGDPSLLPVDEAFRWATKNAAEAFGIDAGEIAVGKRADAVLVDMTHPRMQPCFSLVSNWIYSADSSCVKMVLCDGRIIL